MDKRKKFSEKLGISDNATTRLIRKTYRKLAMLRHPDKHGGSTAAKEDFQEINEAYNYLLKNRKSANIGDEKTTITNRPDKENIHQSETSKPKNESKEGVRPQADLKNSAHEADYLKSSLEKYFTSKTKIAIGAIVLLAISATISINSKKHDIAVINEESMGVTTPKTQWQPSLEEVNSIITKQSSSEEKNENTTIEDQSSASRANRFFEHDPNNKLCKENCRAQVEDEFNKINGNIPSSFQLFREACKQGDHFACLLLADFARRHVLDDDEYPNKFFSSENIIALSRECADHNKYSCYGSGIASNEGYGGNPNRAFAITALNFSCKLGLMDACVELAWIYFERKTLKDYSQALSLLEVACNSGSGMGCHVLGFMNLGGYGVVKSPEKAFALFKKSCDLKASAGCNAIGWCFENGSGINSNIAQAIKYFRLACDTGNGEGCFNLAGLINKYPKESSESGLLSTATSFSFRACKLGFGEACEAIGLTHESGNGLEKSETLAAQYYTKACDQKLHSACVRIAEYYKNQIGVPSSKDLAEYFYAKAKSTEPSSTIKGN